MHRTSFPHPTPDAGPKSRASGPPETSLTGGPIALYFWGIWPYIRLMNKTTPMMTISMPFQASYDMACEGVANVWEAHGLISTEAELEDADILSVRYDGTSNYSSGWPTLTIVFANTNAAKVYTAVWLGMDISKWDVYTDEDVNDYLAHGSFVRS
jgi:hypothetical protein